MATQYDLITTWEDLQHLAVPYMKGPTIQTFIQETPGTGLLGSKIKTSKVEITDKGLVKTYEMGIGGMPVNIGVITENTPLADVQSLPPFTSILLPTGIVGQIEGSRRFGLDVQEFLKSANAIGVERPAEYLIRLAVESSMRSAAMYAASDRHGIMGYVAADPGVPSEDTTKKLFYDDITISHKYLPAFFATPGQQFQVCAPPAAITSGIATLRNFTAPMVLLGLATTNWSSPTAITIRYGCYYTTGTRTTILAEMTDIQAGDVIVPWSKATTSVTDLPVGGPNYGFPGLRWVCETNGSGTFADIEDATGFISTALKTNEDTPRSIDRNAGSKEWDAILNPYVKEGAGAGIGTFLAESALALDEMALNLAGRRGANLNGLALVVSPLILLAMKKALGTSTITAIQNTAERDVLAKRYAALGISGYTYQSPSCGPIPIVASPWLFSDMVLMFDDTQPLFSVVTGMRPAEWITDGGSAFRLAHNAAGQEVHAKQATYKMPWGLFPDALVSQNIAVLRNVTPATS